MIVAEPKWSLTGDYFENCNCDVVCPCVVSTAPPLSSRPTRGVCDVVLAFHIQSGRYRDTPLDGLNAVVAVHTPGPMGQGDWSLAAYLDETADAAQTEALGAIFSGEAGGPMAAFAPLVSRQLGVKKAPIRFSIEGKTRSVEVPGVMAMNVGPIPTMHASGEIWASIGHPVAPDKLALAVGGPGSVFADYGMRWDNSGKNGHYAAIAWSN
jgi:hypothetical protein